MHGNLTRCRRVLVTGASGRVGRHVVDAFVDEHEVTVLDLVPPAQDIPFVEGKVLDLDMVGTAKTQSSTSPASSIPATSVREKQPDFPPEYLPVDEAAEVPQSRGTDGEPPLRRRPPHRRTHRLPALSPQVRPDKFSVLLRSSSHRHRHVLTSRSSPRPRVLARCSQTHTRPTCPTNGGTRDEQSCCVDSITETAEVPKVILRFSAHRASLRSESEYPTNTTAKNHRAARTTRSGQFPLVRAFRQSDSPASPGTCVRTRAT